MMAYSAPNGCHEVHCIFAYLRFRPCISSSLCVTQKKVPLALPYGLLCRYLPSAISDPRRPSRRHQSFEAATMSSRVISSPCFLTGPSLPSFISLVIMSSSPAKAVSVSNQLSLVTRTRSGVCLYRSVNYAQTQDPRHTLLWRHLPVSWPSCQRLETA